MGNEGVESTVQLMRSWYMPLGVVLGCLLIALVVDRILVRYLHRMALKTRWEGDEILLKHLSWRLTLWGLLVGIAVALPLTPLPPSLVVWLNRGVQLILVFTLSWTLSDIVAQLIRTTSITPSGAATTSIFQVIARIGVWGLGIALMLHIFGVSIAPILTALGVGGLALALALQDSLANLFAGIHILLAKQVQIGDYIKLESGEEGYVMDINWRNTTLKALPNNAIIVPNTKLASSIATNYFQPDKTLSVIIPMGVSYSADLEQVERVTIEVAEEVMREVPGGDPEFTPFIRYHTFGDSAVQFSVILRVKEFVNQYLVKHEFIKRVHKRYKEEGIEIPFPQRVVHFPSSASLGIPSDKEMEREK